MTAHFQPNKTISFLVFAAGILLGVILLGGLVQADIEAVFYGLPHLTNNTFDGFYCPPLMTRSEVANLIVTVQNDTDRPIAPLVRVEISAPGLMSSSREKAPKLEPGESATLEWPVSEENIDLKHFIFAKAFRYPDYRTQLAEATCGILVVDVPFFNGNTLLAIWLGASIICTLFGLWMLEKHPQAPGQRASTLSGLRLMAIAMLIGIIFGIQGAWVPGIAMLVIFTLLMLGLLYFSLAH